MLDFSERFQNENSNLWNSFEHCTRELQPIDQGYSGDVIRIDQYTAASLGVELPPSYMVFFMFAYLKKIDYKYKPMEKVLWEIPFQFRDKFFYFTVRKFGFRLISSTEDHEMIKTLIKKVNSAIKIVDRMMSPLLKEVVNKGDITFLNQSNFYHERYLYFKNKASKIYEKDINEEKGITTGFFPSFHSKIQLEREGLFNTQAMLDAYFSYQEHLLILLFPFTDLDKQKYSVVELIGEDWSAKFNEVFSPSKHSDMMKHYVKLKSLKEFYRNKYAHGGFEKNNGSLYAKVDGLGFIPVQVNRTNHFSLIHLDDMGYKEICNIIDKFENYLSNSAQWSRPIKLIQSGLDIYFDDDHIHQYRSAIKSDENLESFIEYESELEARNTDMDW